MPDISMCFAKNCPLAEHCYRNPASGTKPDCDQTSMEFEPELGAKCRGFWLTSKGWTDDPHTH